MEKPRIFLLMPVFHNYHLLVEEQLKQLGYEVDFFENKEHRLNPSPRKAKFIAVRKILYSVYDRRAVYFKKLIKKNKHKHYEFFFAINCYSLTEDSIEILKEAFPQIKTRLFLWDTLNRYNWNNIIKRFDKVFTFDLSDAEKLNLHYLPNFHDCFDFNQSKTIGGVAFVGTQHSDRFNIVNKIYKQILEALPGSFIKLIIYYKPLFYNKYLYKLLSLIYNKDNNEISLNYNLIEKKITADFLEYSSISYNLVKEIYSNAAIILDIDLPDQSGISQRVIFGLALNKKIITTNKNIQHYKDIYNPNKILIIDREDPIIDFEWLKNYNNSFDEKFYLDTRIDNWLKKILS